MKDILVTLSAMLLIFAQPAFAYVDPGSGGMILQLLVAGTVGLGMWIKLYWRRFLSMFHRKSEKTPDASA